MRSIYKAIRVPDHLDDITDFAPESEVDPKDVGMTEANRQLIWEGVQNYYRSGVHPAISLCLRRKGQIVINRTIGYLKTKELDSTDETIRATNDTPICLFSGTKAVTAMLIHYLVEKDLINLTDPVNHYIPEFGAEGKGNTTIYHILSHQGGFPVIPKEVDPEILFEYDQVVDLLCRTKPVSPAGRKISYHAVTGGFILGEIAKRVTGKDLRQLLDETIRRPMGFRFFNYGMPEADQDQVAVNYVTGFPVVFPISVLAVRALGIPWQEAVRLSNDPRFMKTIIPSANLYSTAEEMSRFFQLLLQKGELDGVRVFKPLTVRRAIMETGITPFDRTVVIPMRYSAGMMLGSKPFSLMFGPDTEKAFGHWGFINSFCWADRERDISVALLCTGKALVGPHLTQHFLLLNRIAKNCSKVN